MGEGEGGTLIIMQAELTVNFPRASTKCRL